MKRLLAIALGCVLATSVQAQPATPTEWCSQPVFVVDGEQLDVLDVYLDLIELHDATKDKPKSVEAYAYLYVTGQDETRISGEISKMERQHVEFCHSLGHARTVAMPGEPKVDFEIFSDDFETAGDTFGAKAFKKIRRIVLRHNPSRSEHRAMYHMRGRFLAYSNSATPYFRVEEITVHLTSDK